MNNREFTILVRWTGFLTILHGLLLLGLKYFVWGWESRIPLGTKWEASFFAPDSRLFDIAIFPLAALVIFITGHIFTRVSKNTEKDEVETGSVLKNGQLEKLDRFWALSVVLVIVFIFFFLFILGGAIAGVVMGVHVAGSLYLTAVTLVGTAAAFDTLMRILLRFKLASRFWAYMFAHDKR